MWYVYTIYYFISKANTLQVKEYVRIEELPLEDPVTSTTQTQQ